MGRGRRRCGSRLASRSCGVGSRIFNCEQLPTPVARIRLCPHRPLWGCTWSSRLSCACGRSVASRFPQLSFSMSASGVVEMPERASSATGSTTGRPHVRRQRGRCKPRTAFTSAFRPAPMSSCYQAATPRTIPDRPLSSTRSGFVTRAPIAGCVSSEGILGLLVLSVLPSVAVDVSGC
jgi:hypothetical protein